MIHLSTTPNYSLVAAKVKAKVEWVYDIWGKGQVRERAASDTLRLLPSSFDPQAQALLALRPHLRSAWSSYMPSSHYI